MPCLPVIGVPLGMPAAALVLHGHEQGRVMTSDGFIGNSYAFHALCGPHAGV
jgi:hypothetical protein